MKELRKGDEGNSTILYNIKIPHYDPYDYYGGVLDDKLTDKEFYEKKKREKALNHIIETLTQDMVLVGGRCRSADEYIWYFCLLCGMPHYEGDSLSHIETRHTDWINARWISEPKSKSRIKEGTFAKKHTYPLKPWKDPNSLFCDTEFLKKLLGKEPAKGKECKDDT
ncbi:hypothetical protein KKH23_04615 [Patescibacteria group bacterium]|nr:hypothetical protein [Patescibacteria group bacterium]